MPGRKPIFIWNPAEKTTQELEETFITINGVMDRLERDLKEQVRHGQVTHFLIIGQRGTGRTTHLVLLYERFQKKSKKGWHYEPVLIREEHPGLYGLRGLYEFILTELDQRGGISGISQILKDMDGCEDENLRCALAEDFLKKLWRKSGKRVLLLFDNFNSFVEEQLLPNGDDWRLRSLLQIDSPVVLVATSPIALEEMMDPFSDRRYGGWWHDELRSRCGEQYENAFFQFFLPLYLRPLDEDGIRQLTEARARWDGYESFWDRHKHRFQIITTLTGGNPRLVLSLYRLLCESDISSATDNLKQLLDSLSEYFRARWKRLPERKQRVLHALIEDGTKMSPAQVASRVRLSQNITSKMLERLTSDGIVAYEQTGQRARVYYINDRLFSLWYQMRFIKSLGRRLMGLVEILRQLYCEEERRELYYQLESQTRAAINHQDPSEALRCLESRSYLLATFGDFRIKGRFLTSSLTDYAALGDTRKAVEDLSLIFSEKEMPNSDAIYIAKEAVEGFQREAGPEQALRLCEELERITDRDPAVYLFCAACALEAKEVDHALKYVNRAREMQDVSKENLEKIADLMLEISPGHGYSLVQSAADCYHEILDSYPRESAPQSWARIQSKLGYAYAVLSAGEDGKNIELAIDHYRLALEGDIRADMPELWADTMTNLGNIYLKRKKDDHDDNLDFAIRQYQKALEVSTREKYPVKWANTMMNLGNAYRNRIQGDRAENIERSIRSYEQAIEVFDRGSVEWAMARNNLGAAFSERIRGDRNSNLRKATEHYHAAITAVPDESNYRSNLGMALLEAGRFTEAVDSMKKSLDALKSSDEDILLSEMTKNFICKALGIETPDSEISEPPLTWKQVIEISLGGDTQEAANVLTTVVLSLLKNRSPEQAGALLEALNMEGAEELKASLAAFQPLVAGAGGDRKALEKARTEEREAGEKIRTQLGKISLILFSPGGAESYKEHVRTIANELNKTLGDALGFHIDVVDWRTCFTPDSKLPQDVIGRQAGKNDIFVGVIGEGFGGPSGMSGSGAVKEFNIAYTNWQRFGRPRILFYFNRSAGIPKSDVETIKWGKMLDFKKKMQREGLAWEYGSTGELTDLLSGHLSGIFHEWFPPGKEGRKEKRHPKTDFSRYLHYLKSETMYIDIRGLLTGEGKALEFRTDELYIPLRMTEAGVPRGIIENSEEPQEGNASTFNTFLEHGLSERKLIIKGDPGAGKTTFLRLLTFILCQKWLGEEVKPEYSRLFSGGRLPLPIFIRLGRLTDHIRYSKGRARIQVPEREDSPEWLLHFLDAQAREFNWSMTGEVFRSELEKGRCLIMFDGLDEAPDPTTREKVSALAVNVLKVFPMCSVVLTSRPAALTGGAIPGGFATVEIAPFDQESMEVFIDRWTVALYAGVQEKSRTYSRDLRDALQSRPEIRRMAKNPVMLTALAVVHWNEHRLPEQRAELYESILTWLFKSRAQRPGRLKAVRCRELLQRLALAMFTQSEGRLRQVTLKWAAGTLAPEFGVDQGPEHVEDAGIFLRNEMVDSGIIVERGERLEFWHLSFQEYLAAYEIAGMLDEDRMELLFREKRLFSSEWREVVLLLGGILYKQGDKKVNHFIDSIMAEEPKHSKGSTLSQFAQKVVLFGGIIHDLSPFDFKPANPKYEDLVRGGMGRFDRATYRDVPVQLRIEAADVIGILGDKRLDNDPMIYIPGGRFWMGSQKSDYGKRNFDKGAYGDESPVHEVKLSPFSISKYPITVQQYSRFVEDGGYRRELFWEAGGKKEFGQPRYWENQLQHPSRPVIGVSWYEAAAYAAWAGGRLPTEAEWERAARGSGEGYQRYPWGNYEPTGETANFSISKIGHVTPVGIFPENCSPEGVIGLAGNMYEWCRDWFSREYYKSSSVQGGIRDPQGPEDGDSRVIRGGCYYSVTEYLRCVSRSNVNPRLRNEVIGFRVVFDVES